MREVLMITLLTIAVPVRDNVPPYEKPQSLQEQIQGEWKMTSAVVAGAADKKPKDAEIILNVKGDQLVIREPGWKEPEIAIFTLDAGKKPATIDIQPKKISNGMDLKVEGILKVEGDVLTLCFAQGSKGKRPTQFVSPPNTSIAVLQFKRISRKQ